MLSRRSRVPAVKAGRTIRVSWHRRFFCGLNGTVAGRDVGRSCRNGGKPWTVRAPPKIRNRILAVVPVEGIEPPLLAEHDFESCASTSSATRACGASFGNRLRLALQRGIYIAGYRRRQKKIKIVVAPPNKAGLRACIRRRDRQSAAAAHAAAAFSPLTLPR